jgi:hypothetical protein
MYSSYDIYSSLDSSLCSTEGTDPLVSILDKFVRRNRDFPSFRFRVPLAPWYIVTARHIALWLSSGIMLGTSDRLCR